MDKLNSPLGAGLGNVMKKWAEKTTEEKLDTLRQALMDNRYTVQRVSKIESDIRDFREHEHGFDGKPVLPMKEKYDGGGALSSYDILA